MCLCIVICVLHLVGAISVVIASERAHRCLKGHDGPHFNGTRNGHIIIKHIAVAVAAAGHRAAAYITVL